VLIDGESGTGKELVAHALQTQLDVREIESSIVDLEQALAQGRFREVLYSWLNVRGLSRLVSLHAPAGTAGQRAMH
jgi:DNA-binding NtrC family response regulator